MLKTAKFEDKALLKRSSSIGAEGNARLAAAVLRLPSVDSDSTGAVLQFTMPNGLSLTIDNFVQLCGQPVDCEDWNEARETCGRDGTSAQPIPVNVEVVNHQAMAKRFKPVSKRKAASAAVEAAPAASAGGG